MFSWVSKLKWKDNFFFKAWEGFKSLKNVMHLSKNVKSDCNSSMNSNTVSKFISYLKDGKGKLQSFSLYRKWVHWCMKWDKVCKNRRSGIYGKQSLKKCFKFFKGCPPQILLGPLNTLSPITLISPLEVGERWFSLFYVGEVQLSREGHSNLE